MSGIVDEDAEGHELHVHTWWEFVFEPRALEKHLEALSGGTLSHPSGAALVEIFLSNRKKQLEGGHKGNAEALLQCAVRIATALKWSLEELERQVPEAEWARVLLGEGRMGESDKWAARFEVRRWAGQADEKEKVLQCVAQLEGVEEARDECCRALFVAGLTSEAHAIARKGSAWEKVSLPNALGFDNVAAATWVKSTRPHKRPREEVQSGSGERREEAMDELAMEARARDAYARGETTEAKKIVAELYAWLRSAESRKK